MGVLSTEAMAGASKGVGFFASPLGKLNLILAGFFFVVLIINGISESIQTNSIYPLFRNTLEKVVGADTHLGQSVDALESGARPVKPASIVSKAMPKNVWFWIKFYFNVVTDLFFIYFFCWLVYGFWNAMDNQSLIKNIILTVASFLLISLFVGMVLFFMSLHGKTLPDNEVKCFNLIIKQTYPLHGTIKFFAHFINGDLFHKLGTWMDTDLGQAITGIPQNYNSSSNITMTNASNITSGVSG